MMADSVATSGKVRASALEAEPPSRHITLAAPEYNLEATLSSGQSFRWSSPTRGWTGVIGGRWVRLETLGESIAVETADSESDWNWLRDYLQIEVNLAAILSTFPGDDPMRRAVGACRGLRLLRQDPWECLASFILSSTKRITQIQQIVELLCRRFGDPLPVPSGEPAAFAFPTAERLARCSESELRACKMGFRAPNLLATARRAAEGKIDLTTLHGRSLAEARAELVQLPGVGRKIADCVLLFAYGCPTAFPIDIWVLKALQTLYFPEKLVRPKQLREFSESYFGPQAGYAQQYLFHYMRTHNGARGEPRNRSRRGDAADLGLSRK